MIAAQGGEDMAEASDTQGILRQNLLDAGCGSDMVQMCMALAQKENMTELIHILTQHRRTLLDTVHQNEKRIDCLDYLVYRLEKQSR